MLGRSIDTLVVGITIHVDMWVYCAILRDQGGVWLFGLAFLVSESRRP